MSLKTLLAALLDSCLSLVAPPHCLHCQEPLLRKERLLCSSCCDALELLTPQERCPWCFQESRGPCPTCKALRDRWCDAKAAAFECMGPAATLLHTVRAMPSLVTSMGSWLALQHDALNWPLPDALIPLPPAPWQRGDHVPRLLAHSLGALFKVPVVEGLRQLKVVRPGGPLPEGLFEWRRPITPNQQLLIISDRCSSPLLELAGQALSEANPRRTRALTFAL